MSRRRFNAGELARLLESTSQPLYVLDDSLAIIYLNESCRAWLGDVSEELLGRTCVYQSGETKTAVDALAAALCPPPAVLEGRELIATVAYAAENETRFRRARFVPLRWTEGPVHSIVALVDAHDSPLPLPEVNRPESDDARELHLHLQTFRQKSRLRQRAVCVIGVTPAARRAAAQAELAAASRASVHLLGPAGSGRRQLGEAIHYASRQSGPLIPLECGLLDAELIRTTIRSATSTAGEGGTLLLLDADRMPVEAQAELAAFVSSSNFSWRTIATSGAPLADLARQGPFREDLAAMLGTIVIELPPLAKRRDDLPLLAQALLEEQNARGGKQLGGFAPEALDRLFVYAWPGNFAELAQVVSESHLRAAGAQVARDDLPDRLRHAADAAARPRRKEEPIQLDEFIAGIERELIRRALSRSKGNKAKAARLLGLNRPRLYRRMVQLGLIEKDAAE